MKATEQYFPVVLFIMLYKVVLTFESGDEILKCDHWDESYWAVVLSCGAVYYAVQGGSNVWVCGWNSKVWPFRWKLLSSSFLWCCLLYCTRWMKSLSVVFQVEVLSRMFLWFCFRFCFVSLFFFVNVVWTLSVFEALLVSALYKQAPSWC